MLDLKFVRAQFPAFHQDDLKSWAFFENAGGSYPCRQVVQRLTSFYTENKVQVNYPYPTSMKAGQLMEASYDRMASWLNVKAAEIHFGPSTTQNVYVLAQAFKKMLKAGDEIILSCQDHEANSGAWRRLEADGIRIVDWPVNAESGLLELETLKELISPKTRLLAYPHCSNVIGEVNPVEEISALAKRHNIISVVDGVGYAPHAFPDLRQLGAEVYLFSLYKTFGPHLGLMFVDESLMENLENQSHYFKEGIARSMLTPAGPDHAQIAAASGILDYFEQLYAHHFEVQQSASENLSDAQKMEALNALFHEREKALMAPIFDFLKRRDDLRVLGTLNLENRAPIISVLPLNKNPKKVYGLLTKHQLMCGIGFFYAARPLNGMGIALDPGVLRFSFLHYTSEDDVDQLIHGLEASLRDA